MSDPGTRHYWDEVAEQWLVASPDRLWRAFSDELNMALFSAWLPAQPPNFLLKTDLFDEATGPGLGQLLAQNPIHWVGMDISLTIVHSAHLHYGMMKRACADVRHLPFKDDCMDVILSNSTLDHFDSLVEISTSLAECIRVLKPGGLLLMTVDNLLNPVVAIRNALPFSLLKRLKLVPYQMGKTCSPGKLRQLVQAAGFKIEELKAILHCPRLLAVRRSRQVDQASAQEVETYMRNLWAWERLANWPTRFLTGYYLALKAHKPL